MSSHSRLRRSHVPAVPERRPREQSAPRAGPAGSTSTSRFNLRINYRTTEQILRWSLGLLTGERFDDLDAGTATLAGYRSETQGPWPVLHPFDQMDQELAALVSAVREWLNRGIEPGAIGVTARTKPTCSKALRTLAQAGIPTYDLERHEPSDGVAVASMHRMKGLEYRCMAVIDANARSIPLPWAVTPEAEDPVAHQRDLQRERCLLYVACTRARENLRVSWSGTPSPIPQMKDEMCLGFGRVEGSVPTLLSSFSFARTSIRPSSTELGR